MTSDRVATYLDSLDERYVALHTAKEDAFWSAKMGLGEDPTKSQVELDARDLAVQQFLQDPKQLAGLPELLPSAQTDALKLRAEGWERTFAAHTIDSSAGAALAEELAADDGRLQIARGEMKLGFEDPAQGFVAASSVKLSNMNSVGFTEFIRRLTGQALSAAPLAARLNQTVEERRVEAHDSVAKLASIPLAAGPLDLDARIHVVHGSESVAELDGDFGRFAARFATWIDGHGHAHA
jgi:hypothetical protein